MNTTTNSIVEANTTTNPGNTCDYAGCDGNLHETEPTGSDLHTIDEQTFDDIASVAILIDPEKPDKGLGGAYVLLDSSGVFDSEVTPDELRKIADDWESFPQFLRDYADNAERYINGLQPPSGTVLSPSNRLVREGEAEMEYLCNADLRARFGYDEERDSYIIHSANAGSAS